jgi:hypothetical protein
MSITPLALMRPVAVAAAQITATNVAELHPTYDAAAWNAATVYAIGDLVARPATHRTYQRRTVGATPGAPESDPTNWADIGATNAYKAFDKVYQAQVQNADTIVYTLSFPEYVDSITALNCECANATVTVQDTDYAQTIFMYTRPDVDNLLDFFIEPWEFKSEVSFRDMPLLIGKQITITLDNTGGVAKVGEIVPSLARDIGGVKFGARTGIVDYSVKSVDQWGSITVAERPYSKRMTLDLEVDNTFIDAMQRLFAKYRAQPVVIVGNGNVYDCLIGYGYIKEFENVIEFATKSLCNLDFESLT